MEKHNEKLFIAIDGNAIIHRAFHAYPPTLSTRSGLQVNAVYGFTTMLLEVLKRFDPHYIVCTFDTGKPTFRHVQYTEYKAQRKPVDQSLVDQFPLVEEVVKAFNIPILKKDGFEADDILGTLTKYVKDGKWSGQGLKMVVVSGDRDLLQLISDDVNICLPQGNFKSLTVFNRTSTFEKFGYYPEQVIDYKGIVGDASDNIPGIKGVGDKSALDLLAKYGSFDEIYKHLSELKPKQQVLFGEGIEQAEFSRDLATIKRDVELDVTLDQCVMKDFKRKDVEDVLVKFEFRSLVGRIPQSNESLVREVEMAAPQLSLFGEVVDGGGGASNTGSFGKAANTGVSDTPLGMFDGDLEGVKVLGKDIAEDELVKMLEKSSKTSLIFLSKDEMVDGGEVLALRVEMDGNFDYVIVHINEENVVKLSPSCFTRGRGVSVSCETLTYNWEDYVSRVMRNFPDEIETGGDGISDICLAAHYLSAGRRDTHFATLCFDYLGAAVPEKRSLSEVKSLFGLMDKIREKQVEQFELRKDFLSVNFDKVQRLVELGVGGDAYSAFKFVENNSAVILAYMEGKGVLIDIEALAKFKKEVSEAYYKVQQEIYYLIGHEFNINSPKQLSAVLFSQLQLPMSGKGKKAGSTRESVLEELGDVHPVISKTLEYRQLSKLLTSYAESFSNIVAMTTEKDVAYDGHEGKVIHTDFKLTGASSGRLASLNPNLQNLPAQGDWAMQFRDIFVARKGFKLVSIDYSQIELRIMADISNDEAMIDDFKKGKDIHKATATRIFNKDEKDITKEERSRAKTINFGILYGQTPFGLSRQLKIEQKLASQYITEYFNDYPGVAKYIDRVALEAQERGYVATFLGRRRYIQGLDSKNAAVRNAAIREAINMPIQGTAADLMKIAMIQIYELIQKKYVGKAFLLLQVHDEFILEVEEGVLKEFEDEAANIMRNAVKLSVPLEVHVSDGFKMSELK